MKWISELGEEHWDWKGICFLVFFMLPALVCLAIAMAVVAWLVVLSF